MNAFIKSAALAVAAVSLAGAVPASAQTYPDHAQERFESHGAQAWQQGRDRYGYSREDSRRGYRNPYRGEPVYRDTRVWRGEDGRTYCRRQDGTTGLVIGGVAGAVAGNVIDGGRERTLGTVLGAVAGALLGREIDRGGTRCR